MKPDDVESMLFYSTNKQIESEKEAILKFLNNQWDIEVAGQKQLPEIINDLLIEGGKFGIVYQEEKTEEAINAYNKNIDLIKSLDKKSDAKHMNFTKTNIQDYTPKDYIIQVEQLRTVVDEEWNMAAHPKEYSEFKEKYKNDDFPPIEEKELVFEGHPLHQSLLHYSYLGESNFQEALTKSSIKYHEDRDRDSLTILIKAILRQGMIIGVNFVEEQYGPISDIYKRVMNLLD